MPNSYNKKPITVDVKLDKKGEPMVLLTFNSATSDSVREYLLMQNEALQSVNGVMNNLKNQELIDVWNDFKEQIKDRTRYYTDRESVINKKAKRMINDANKMLGYGDIYELEQVFLEKYKDAKFDTISYLNDSYGMVAAFVLLISDGSGGYKFGVPAVPFSPRTLEYCILHVTDGDKIEYGEYVEDFEKMCREIQKYSCFESED